MGTSALKATTEMLHLVSAPGPDKAISTHRTGLNSETGARNKYGKHLQITFVRQS